MRTLFAGFWILLAGFSGFYLFTLFTDPAALGGQAMRASTEPKEEEIPAASTGTPAITPDQAAALLQADQARDSELGEIKSSVQVMSDQIAELNTRLQPIEQFVGPVAALPRATSVTTSPPGPPPAETPAAQSAPPPAEPAPEPAPEQAATPEPEPVPPPPDRVPERPAPTAEAAPAQSPETPPAPVAEATPEPAAPEPEPVPAPVAAPEPADDPTPEPSAAPEPAAAEPEPTETAESQPAAPAAEEDDAADASAATTETATADPEPVPAATEQPAPAPPPEGMETAALDPINLPPAANDGTTRYGIEIGVVVKRDGLRPLWREYLTNHAALVAGLQPRRVLAPDKKWRLIAGPFANAQEAEAACSLFKKAERPCAATVYAGDSL
jgi:SPOR domain